jgi:error-prone DNA polymerase
MPDSPITKARSHPAKAPAPAVIARSGPAPAARYAELQTTSNFSFLTGASHPEELAAEASRLGLSALAVTDRHTLAGIVRAHVGARDAGLPLVVGARLDLWSSPWWDTRPAPADAVARGVLVYATDRPSYGRLCRLLTIGKRRAPKGQCRLTHADLAEHQGGLLAAALHPHAHDPGFPSFLAALRDLFDDDRLSLAASCAYGPDDEAHLARLASIARSAAVPLLATNDVHYHTRDRRPLQDVLTCVRHGCTIQSAGRRLFPNAERCLKPPLDMQRLFREHPAAIARTIAIADRAAGFSLDQLRYEYPDEIVPPGTSPREYLADLTRRGAAERYPAGVPDKVSAQIRHELALIAELRYEPYFLTVRDIVVFARARGILCQGRGAAANSAVCYCLGITAVDPARIDVLFERFISRERNEPPDIDIDFEHERREEVIQYLYDTYGRDRAALTAEVISYRSRSAVRDVGKALGLSLDAVDRLAKTLDWWQGSIDPASIREAGFNPDDPTLRMVVALTAQVAGFPRHLSQHVGGFVITRGPLCESVPIENAAMPDRTVIEWDKDDLDAMGMLKVDVLGLGMLTCIRKCFDLVERHHARPLTLATVPPEDPRVYDMLCRADTIGVFQIESRAQMSMLPRLRPRCFYDLVIEVAIVRPGPIQGDMVHPYLRRRSGQEPVVYPDERVRQVLGKTLGVPLFQEQAMALAIVAAGFTPGQADSLRRAMAAWKRKGDQIHRFGEMLIAGMLARGYPPEFARRCFEQIKGFSEYGFPESHAASFALLVYVSGWLKHHHPAAFAAALLNSQPMGFYAPAQIVRDARDHGVSVLPVDVNHSDWDCTLEGPPNAPAIRLGLRLARGLAHADARRIADAVRRSGAAPSVDALRRASGVGIACLRTLAAADAFRSMGLDRQGALWAVRRLRDEPLPLFDALPGPHPDEPPVPLPSIPLARTIRSDYHATGLSLKAHPLSLVRSRLDELKVTPARNLRDAAITPAGLDVRVAGLVLVRQRPGTASGIVFMTIEDDTGVANLILYSDIYQRFRREARHSLAVLATGRVERQGDVVHVMVRRIADLRHSVPLDALSRVHSRDFH